MARTLAWVTRSAVGAALATAGYVGLVTGGCPIDLRLGRRDRPLGPQVVAIEAPRDVVFDVIASPYLGRATRAMQEKVKVLERGADMVLAAHYTPVHGRLRAETVETVRFTRPERVDFRLVRGPVPYVVEAFVLTDTPTGSRLEYTGEMAADLWRLGWWWSGVVARRWEAAVASSLDSVKREAEHRSKRRS
ncbi:MAG: SRPBCC family protein [Acidimicrobiales bacterium]